jgi:hypothetical protein
VSAWGQLCPEQSGLLLLATTALLRPTVRLAALIWLHVCCVAHAQMQQPSDHTLRAMSD